MNRKKKDMFLFDDDKIYAEAKKRIKECGEKRAKKLDLSKLNLKEIPPEIAELQTLEELNITSISLKKVPSFLGNILSLKKLLLGSRYSSAHKQEKVMLPAELGNLRNLQDLSLGYDIPEIPSWVWTLDNLETLSICNDSIESIPAEIADMKRLRELQIYSEKIARLPKEIGEKLSLTALDLQCPKLEALPDSFANLKAMRYFSFTLCNLTAIPGYICDWTNLEEFELSMANSFQGPYTKLKTIPKNIGNLRKLRHFNLDGGSITKIPDSLGNCPLIQLNLSGDFSIVPETLGNCSGLKTIKLVSGKPISLPDSLGKLLSLKELEILAPALEVPESFVKLSSLEDLDLKIDKEFVLPKSFGSLSALKELWIVSQQMRKIPDSIGNCKNLKRITIDSDKLTALPESFCKLHALEELRLNTFALKALPSAFGSLTSLKSLDIFSGALTVLPESIGGLKNLVYLDIDAYNVKKLPESFKKLSYIKELVIEIGNNEPVLAKKSAVKKNGLASFEELSTMSWRYSGKLFEAYSIKQLETLLCSAPKDFPSRNDREIFRDIMLERYCRLRNKFKWTEENKKRIAKVSDEFLRAWEDGFARAKLIAETLYEKSQDKKSFQDKYIIEITLYPEILFSEDEEMNDWELYDNITRYLYPGVELTMQISYDPVTKNEDDFWENGHVNRDLSWNIEGFGDIALEGYYICYALHILYSHNHWAFQDIPRINHILTEIKVTCDGENF